MTSSAARYAVISAAMLAAWLGAAGFLSAVVAPAAFAVLPTRALAGAIVGRALPVLFVLGIAFGIGVAVMNRVIGAERRATIASATYASACAAALLVALRLDRELKDLGVPVDTLALTDARRIAFGRMHGMSVMFMGVGMVAAVIALIVVSQHVASRTSTTIR
ncbi:MAG: DUF4149 domain-containing protein [Gemmatimonadaceae bacterium]